MQIVRARLKEALLINHPYILHSCIGLGYVEWSVQTKPISSFLACYPGNLNQKEPQAKYYCKM